MTALMYSSFHNGDYKELEYNITHTRDPTLTVQDGKYQGCTALHLFLTKSWPHLKDSELSKLINLYLQAGFDVQAPSRSGATPTYSALQSPRASTFFIWCDVLRGYQSHSGASIEEFTSIEITRCRYYVENGWTLEALTYLLREEFSPDVEHVCPACLGRKYKETRRTLREVCMEKTFPEVKEALDIEETSFLLRIGDVYEQPPSKSRKALPTSMNTFPSRVFNAVLFPCYGKACGFCGFHEAKRSTFWTSPS